MVHGRHGSFRPVSWISLKSRWCGPLGPVIALVAGISQVDLARAQADYTNTITGNVTELWDASAEWGGTVPGWSLELGTGNSNDNAWVLFRTTSATTQAPQLNLAGSNWVLNTLYISEDTVGSHNADGNFLSRQGSTDVAGGLTLQQIDYYEGGRELDFQTGVRIFDKTDGAALIIQNANTLDFWDTVTGTEGLTLGRAGTLLLRNYEITYGSTPETGLTFDGATGGKYFMFNLSNTNADVVHGIPNVTYVGAADPTMFFMRSLGTNNVTVSISNITFSANRPAFRVGGQSAADGGAIVTVNVEGELAFTNNTTGGDRTLDIGSVHNGRVNINGGILIDQGIDSGRTLVLSGNGAVNMNSDVRAISGFGLFEAFTNTVRLDGDRNLEVVLDQQGRFGQAERIDLRGGTVLKLDYDAFAAGYPGQRLTNLAGVTSIDSRAWFIEFGTVQSGFYDPYDTNQPFLVRALTGVGGNLSNAIYTGDTPNMIFETNAVIMDGTVHGPTTSDIGENVVYLGIRDAGGTNNDLGAAGTIYKGAALGAPTYIGESRSYTTNGAVTDPASGFYGTLGAAAGKDLEVMVLNSTFVSPNSFSEVAQFNADTGVGNFVGPGQLAFTADQFAAAVGHAAWGGSITQLNRIGYAESETNLYGFHTQNSSILVLGINAIPTGKVVYVDNGLVQLDHGEAIGGNGPQDNVNATLHIGSNATLVLDANDQITRGRIVTDPGAFVYISGGADRLTARTPITNSWLLSPDSAFILDDYNGLRNVADPMYELMLRSMNVILGDDVATNYIVRAASGAIQGGDWEIGEGRRITTGSDQNATLNRIYTNTIDYGVRLMDGATNMTISAAASRTMLFNVNVHATNQWGNANLMIGDTNDFTTVALGSGAGYRRTVAQTGTVNLFGPTNRFDSATLVAGTATLSNDVLVAGTLTVTNGRTLTVAGVSNTIATAIVNGTLTVPVTAGSTLIGELNHLAGTSTIDGSTNRIGSISGLAGAVNVRGSYNAISNIYMSGGADLAIGNGADDFTQIYGDVYVEDGPEGPLNRTLINFAQGTIEVGNVYMGTVTSTNSGVAGYDNAVAFYAPTSIVHGTVYIGLTNQPGMAAARVIFGDGAPSSTDFTEVKGDVILDSAGTSNANMYSYFARGDAIVRGDVIINLSGSNYTQMLRPQGNTQGFLIEADQDPNTSDGVGFYDRLRDGTLVQGTNGFLIKPYGYLRIEAPITNDIFWVGQKITVDNAGPAYGFNDRTLWFNADTNIVYGLPPSASFAPINVTNVWMREGAHLRVNNESTRTDARVGLILDGTNDGSVSYLGKGGASDDIKLLDIASSSAQARVLQVGNTNIATEVFLNALLMGAVSPEVTLSVFNGRLSMTNGAAILGTAEVARDGSVFDIVPGTTGFVNGVNMLAGTFSNRGDLMAFGDVTVSGGQAFMGGATSYATNLNLYGGTAIVESVGLGQVTFDGGSLRADADRVIAADQGVRVTNIANGGVGTVIVDNGVTVAIANAVEGDGTLAKAGLGTLILSNANQQAGTSVREGTLLYSADNRLRTDAGGTITMEGGVLDLNTFNQDSTGTVTFAGGLVTNGTITKAGADFDAQAGEVAATLQGTAGLTKTGAGTTILSGSNAYQGATVVVEGSLRIDNANGLPGGIGATGGTSALVLTNGGVLGIGIGETFARDLGTGIEDVQWTGSGGFAAYGADRYVNIGGATQTLVWGQANFVSGENELVFGAADSTHTLIFENNIEMDGTNRFRANNGFADVDGRITGNLSDKSGSVGTFFKTGDGVLELAGSNTYSGGTEVLGGQLLLSGSNALSENSLLTISNYGVITLGATDFTRDLGTNGGDVVWTGSGGFAASGADRIVNIGGNTQQLVWGSAFFVPEGVNGSTLVLGRTGTTHTVDFQNDIDLGASNRTVWAGNGDAAIDAVLSGVLSGSGGLIKVSPGTLMLNNTNLFTGGLEVQNGRLVLDGGDNRLQAMAAVLGSTNDDSGVLQLGGAGGKSDQTFTGLTTVGAGAGNAVVGGATDLSALTLNIGGGITNIYGGLLGGAGLNENNLALYKTGDGILVLTSANTYTGKTTVTGGVLAVDAAQRLGGAPASLVTDQLTLDGGIFAAIGTFGMDPNRGITLGTNGGMIWVDASCFLTNTGGIYGPGSLTKIGDGVLILTADNSYASNTVVAGGVMRLDSASALPGGTLATGGTSALTLTGGGILGLGAGDFTRALGTGVSNVAWAGSGGFAAYGADRVVNIGGLATPSTLTWGSGGFVPDGEALVLSSPDASHNLIFSNRIALGSGQRTILTHNGSATIADAQLAGIVSGAGGITKTGNGTLFLSGVSTYTGKTIIEEGRLRIAAETGLGGNPGAYTSDQLTLNGGTLYADRANVTIDDPNRGIYLGEEGGTFEVHRSSGTGTFTLRIDNSIGGPGGLTKTGSQYLRLYGANTYTGITYLPAGWIQLTNENALGSNPDTFVGNQLHFNGGGLQVIGAGTDMVIDDANRGISNAGTAYFSIDTGNSLTISNVISGGGTLVKQGNGLLALHATNTRYGTIEIRAGTLSVAGEEGLGDNPLTYGGSRLYFTNNGVLRATESFAINDPNRGIEIRGNTNLPAFVSSGGIFEVMPDVTLEISNRITGTGQLGKIGDGTLILSSLTNTYSGGTVIAGGTLGIRDERNLGTNPVFYAGNLTISNGGILRALATLSIDNPNKSIVIGEGGGGFEVDPTFTLTLSSNLVADNLVTKYGAGRLNVYGSSNVFTGLRAENGTLVFNDSTDDQTLINGNLVFNAETNLQISTYHQVIRGDFSATGNIVLNEGRLKPADHESTLFKLDATTNDFGPVGMTPTIDGLGVWERMWFGTLAQGADGVVVRDFARFEFAMPRSNMVFNVGQKITIDTQGPNYSANERLLDFRAENLGAYASGTMTFNVTNVFMNPGAYLRINEENSIVRVGLTLKGDAYLSESTSGNADDFDLLDVISDTPGAGRTLQIGTVDGFADTAFNSTLFGTGATEVTFNVFNGSLTMTNGATIFGVAQMSNSGALFIVAPGTTGSVHEVRVLDGSFQNNGDLMSFSNVVVYGAGAAQFDGRQSYITNLLLSGVGSRATFASPDVGLGNFTIDGGEVRVVTNYTLNAAQNVTLGPAGAGFRIAEDTTLMVSNVLEGSGGLTKLGPGTMVMGNTSTYEGDTAIERGRMVLAGGANDRLPTNTFVTMGGGVDSGILQLGDAAGSSDQTLAGLTTSGGGTDNRVVGGNASISRLTLDIAGGVTNTYGGALGGPGANENALALTKAGAGILVLEGTNTYLGQTSVGAGTLLINGDNSAASGIVSVLANAVLGGDGIIGGATIFQADAMNAPGFLAPGIETFANGVTYSNASIFQWELVANSTGSRGTGFDGVDLTGSELNVVSGSIMSLVFNGQGSAVDWSDAFWDAGQQWLVFDLLGTATTNSTSSAFVIDSTYLDSLSMDLATMRPGAMFFTSYTPEGDLYLNYAIPEPSTWALLCSGLGAVVFLSRRQSRRKYAGGICRPKSDRFPGMDPKRKFLA